MADDKNKIDRLHDLMPSHLNTKTNENWSAILGAIGEADQRTADLIAAVRQQFFVKTANRPYLDILAANNKIARPPLVGMDDPSMRQYVPVLSYKPKQVKLIIDDLLDIFFFKESTTAYTTSANTANFYLEDGWELIYTIDENFSELVKFTANDFTDISSVTANELVAAINRQTKYSYATTFYDSITKSEYIKIFTNTVGSKGSIRIVGGRANVSLRFPGFISTAGNGSNTQWSVAKVGDSTSFEFIGGTSPSLDQVIAGDIVIIDIPGNIGSYEIREVDVAANTIRFTNLFSTPGVFTQTTANDVKFIRPIKVVAYTNPLRAITWETKSGEIVVEMPSSPPVVKRSLKGSWHLNGEFSIMANRNSDSSMLLTDATNFPNSGTFFIEAIEETQVKWSTPDEVTLASQTNNTRLHFRPIKYSYTSRTALTTTGNIVEGSSQITNLASVIGLAVGQDIVMEGVPPYAKVESISGDIANITAPATESAVSRSVSFLGNELTGITPALPAAAGLNEFNNSSLVRTSNIVTVTTSTAHTYSAGETVVIDDCSGILAASTSGDILTGSNQITNVADMTGVAIGQIIDMTGFPFRTKITDVSGNTITVNKLSTATSVGELVDILEDVNGPSQIISATGSTFTFLKLGTDGAAATPGVARVERSGLANSGSKIILTSATDNLTTRISGAYIWDQAAPFVLSSDTATIGANIQAGKIVRLITIGPNNLPADGGQIVFDYGLNTQEGPVRYLYKPTANTIALDPSYVFQKNHALGSSLTRILKNGPHIMSTRGDEYPPYITNPSDARFILQDLIRSVKSAGIFVDFLIRYPEQFYATLDVYDKQGLGSGEPFI
jgi:hypothetical protein